MRSLSTHRTATGHFARTYRLELWSIVNSCLALATHLKGGRAAIPMWESEGLERHGRGGALISGTGGHGGHARARSASMVVNEAENERATTRPRRPCHDAADARHRTDAAGAAARKHGGGEPTAPPNTTGSCPPPPPGSKAEKNGGGIGSGGGGRWPT